MTTFHLDRLDHVSLNVGDRPASIAWYRDVLGLEQRNEPRQDDWPVFMGEFGSCIALFQAAVVVRARQGVDRSAPRRLHGRQDDLERAQEHLVAHGVEFRAEDHGNALSVYLTDPDGNVVELTTYVR